MAQHMLVYYKYVAGATHIFQDLKKFCEERAEGLTELFRRAVQKGCGRAHEILDAAGPRSGWELLMQNRPGVRMFAASSCICTGGRAAAVRVCSLPGSFREDRHKGDGPSSALRGALRIQLRAFFRLARSGACSFILFSSHRPSLRRLPAFFVHRDAERSCLLPGLTSEGAACSASKAAKLRQLRPDVGFLRGRLASRLPKNRVSFINICRSGSRSPCRTEPAKPAHCFAAGEKSGPGAASFLRYVVLFVLRCGSYAMYVSI